MTTDSCCCLSMHGCGIDIQNLARRPQRQASVPTQDVRDTHKKSARRGAGDAPSGRSSSGWLGQREVFVEKATTHLVRQVRSCRHPILDYPVLPQSHVTLPFVQRQEMVV